MKNALHSFFYANYFYGCCALVLCLEACLQQQAPLPPAWYFLLVFIATVAYYNQAYLAEMPANTDNLRLQWYARHRVLMRRTQFFLLAILALSLLFFLFFNLDKLLKVPLQLYFLLALFPLVGILYYGIGNYNLRRLGWAKPFLIGFVWSGWVTVYPVVFYNIYNEIHYESNLLILLLFIKNFIFISILAILFDIKDYEADYNQQIKTFVVRMGLHKTIYFVIVPLSVLSFASFVFYGNLRGFSIAKILLHTLPFLGLIALAYSLHRPRSILFYLVIIDGLLLVKAFLGIIATIFF